MRHRIMLSYEALADEMQLGDIVTQLIASIKPPQVHIGDPYRDSKSNPTSQARAT